MPAILCGNKIKLISGGWEEMIWWTLSLLTTSNPGNNARPLVSIISSNSCMASRRTNLMESLADSGNIWQRLYNCLLNKNITEMTSENKSTKTQTANLKTIFLCSRLLTRQGRKEACRWIHILFGGCWALNPFHALQAALHCRTVSPAWWIHFSYYNGWPFGGPGAISSSILW